MPPPSTPETLPIVRQLREELAMVTAERDAAVSDIETAMAYPNDNCRFCKNANCQSRNGTKPCLPKWRGPAEGGMSVDFQNLTTEQKQKLMLALKACVYGTITNRRCECATYTCDIKKKHGGPYYIPFDTAAEMVMDLAKSLEDADTWPGEETNP